ncbi:YggT family protein [Agrilactobacillus fermenti]|uniref:YggT family protein n=1 Tax=Agrilactobacillus fermenti TaxID=2586909 RepID=UPI001E5BBC8F|nr:YggT family protein [Agrilactobacillus fermenti]MCD2255307.1 YggT family protein [Agrilactobacillus fermenti]
MSLLALLYIGVKWIFDIYTFLIVIYTLLSWVPGAYNSKLGQLLGRIVGPFLGVFDRIIPSIMGISFSPIVAILALQFIEIGLLKFLSIFMV